MNIDSICKTRFIKKIDVKTPLVIPSFSSVADGKIGEIFRMLREHIPETCLVSAYDLSSDFIDRDSIWVSDVIFLDSGNYEKEKKRRLINHHEWTIGNYIDLIKSLNPLSSLVLISFDQKEQLLAQIKNAQDFFSNFNDFANCFLCRPEKNHSVIDVDQLINNISSLAFFDVLGIAEKELGESPLIRCSNILKIRKAMDAQSLELPIHVFGCLNPLGIISYFLSGADVFDGTLWLKFSLCDNLALYLNDAGIINGEWSLNDDYFRNQTHVLNLKKLSDLMYNLGKYSRNYDLKVLELDETQLNEVKNIISKIGITLM